MSKERAIWVRAGGTEHNIARQPVQWGSGLPLRRAFFSSLKGERRAAERGEEGRRRRGEGRVGGGGGGEEEGGRA